MSDHADPHVLALIRRMADTEAELRRLLGNDIDMVLDPVTGTPLFFQETRQALLRAQDELRQANEQLERRVEERTQELKRANEELRHIRDDFDRAQQVGQIGSWRLDVQRNVLTWSDQTYRIFGLPIGTPLTYETFLGMIHPADREYVDTQWKAALSGAPYDIEHCIVADGEVKWVREKAYVAVKLRMYQFRRLKNVRPFVC